MRFDLMNIEDVYDIAYDDEKGMEHEFFECKCNKTYCQFCDGGLVYSVKCKSGALTPAEEFLIYDLRALYFRNGQWVDKPNFKRYRWPVEVFRHMWE